MTTDPDTEQLSALGAAYDTLERELERMPDTPYEDEDRDTLRNALDWIQAKLDEAADDGA